MRSFLTTVLLCYLCQGFCQVPVFKKGAIIDSIQIPGAPLETFALYLPKDFNAAALSAVVFIFDPSGRGHGGIAPFIQAAEGYDYILISSNVTKNGPFEANFKAADTLFEYIFATFNIDPNRIYAAGFSGGSRLASAIAVLSGAFQGVIGCGAGMAHEPHYIPHGQNKFSYVGLVGDRDMNYLEMLGLGKWLDTFDIANELFVYDDNHRWPPPKQLLRAFDWLELQAYKKNIKAVDRALIDSLYKRDCHLANSMKTKSDLLGSVDELQRIERNYSAYFNLDSIRQEENEIRKAKEYKRTLREWNKVLLLEDTLSMGYIEKFNGDIGQPRLPDDLSWWTAALKRLERLEKKNEGLFHKKMFERIQYKLFALAIESSYSALWENNFEKALYCDRLLALLRPDQPFVYIRLAQSFARANDLEKTLEQLEIAHELGFKDREIVMRNPEFQRFMSSPKFKKFLDGLQSISDN